jgi:hypothetical protein
MIMALLEGADSSKLLEQTKILYPDAEPAHIFLEVIPFFDTEILRIARGYTRNKAKLSFVEVAQVILSGTAQAMEIETGKRIAVTLKKYPKHYDALKIVVQEMIRQLNGLIED